MELNDAWTPKSRCACKHGNRCAYNNNQWQTILSDDGWIGTSAENLSVFCHTRPANEDEHGFTRTVMAPPLIAGHGIVEQMSADARRTLQSSHRCPLAMNGAFCKRPKRPVKRSPAPSSTNRESPAMSGLEELRVSYVVGDSDG